MQIRTAKFGEFLKHRKEFIKIDDTETYKRARVQLHWKGIVVRDEIEGAVIKTKEQQVARAGELLVAEIDAKVGGIGIVPPDVDSAVVSSHYFLFQIDEAKCSREWLDWFIHSGGLEDQITARGSTNYAAIRPQHVLEFDLPIPPLDEQRRIVSRIEELATKVQEARGLRRDILQTAQRVVTAEAESCFRTLAANHRTMKFSDFNPHVTSGPRNWGEYYSDTGLRFYRAQDITSDFGLADGSKVHVARPKNGQAESAHLHPGDLMLVITGATVGRCAVFPLGGEPGLVNQHVALCRLPNDSVVPEYVLWGLRSERGQEQLLRQRYGQGKPGLNLNNIRALNLPFPSIDDQRRIVAYLDDLQAKVDSLKKLQSETAAELDALMPSILFRAFRGEL